MNSTREKNTRPYRHVLCVYPYRKELKSLGFLPPLGLEYIASIIEPYADRLDIVDLRRDPARAADFIQPDTDLVCFSVNWDKEKEFVRSEIESVGPRVATIVGGRHATEEPDKWLEDFPNIDAVVRGDGEETMRDICRQVPWGRIQGLSYRDNDRIYHNPNRDPGPIQDDVTPCRPRRKYKYDALMSGIRSGLEVDMVTGSVGCPFNCAFCSFSRNPWGVKRKWSARSPESVVDELKQISAPIVGFTDDLFTHDMARVERICDLILENGIKKKYIINSRLEIAKHPRIMSKMEKAGFSVLLLGIESAHDKTLKSMRKGFNTEDIRRYCRAMRHTKMIKHGYFILGNIGETPGEMLKMASFAKEIGLDSISLSALRLSPYSGLEELVAQSPGYYISRGGKIYSEQCPRNIQKQLRHKINRRFYDSRQIINLLDKLRRNEILQLVPWNTLATGLLKKVVKGETAQFSGPGNGRSERF